MKVTSPTLLTVSSTCLICLSTISLISFCDRFPLTAMVRIGFESGSIFMIRGARVSRGNWLVMEATLSRTSCTAASMSRSRTNMMMTREPPCWELERSSSIPAMVLTTSSIGLVIWVSTSSALAPGRLVCTNTTGASVFGMRSSPSWL